MLQPRLLNPSGMAVSIAAHLTVLTVGLGYAGVRPFETVPVEAIAVDLVTPAEAKEATQETPPKPKPSLEIPDLSTREQPVAAAKLAAPQPPPQQPAQQAMPSAAAATATADAKHAAIRPAPAAGVLAPSGTRSQRQVSSQSGSTARRRLRHGGVHRRQGVDR
jgi:hypothetical protein